MIGETVIVMDPESFDYLKWGIVKHINDNQIEVAILNTTPVHTFTRE